MIISLKVINIALVMSFFFLSSASLLAETDKDSERNTSSEDKYSEPKGSTQNNDPGNAKNIKGSSQNSGFSGSNSGSEGTGQESGGWFKFRHPGLWLIQWWCWKIALELIFTKIP